MSAKPLWRHPVAHGMDEDEIRATEMIVRLIVEMDEGKLSFTESAIASALYDLLCESIGRFSLEESATIAGVAAYLMRRAQVPGFYPVPFTPNH
jgi:hypothetical protein